MARGQVKTLLGESMRAYARRCGVDEGSVRFAVKSGRLATFPDGSIDPEVPWPGDPARAAEREGRSVVPSTPADVRPVTDAPQSPTVFVALGGSTARDALSGLKRGGRVIGITKGQFSMLDIIQALMDRTGPAKVLVSSWRVGADAADALARDSRLLSFRLLVDYGFGKVEPDTAVRVVRAFGESAIWLCRTHAKFAVVQGDGWNLCVRSSMNLNKNPRFEQFDVDDSADICAHFLRFADQCATALPPGMTTGWEQVREQLDAALDGRNAGDLESEEAARTEHVMVHNAAQGERLRAKVAKAGAADGEDDYYAARARKMAAEAEIAERRNRVEAGELVNAVQVETGAFQSARAVRDALLLVPTRTIKSIRAAVTDIAARKILDHELRRALSTLADEFDKEWQHESEPNPTDPASADAGVDDADALTA